MTYDSLQEQRQLPRDLEAEEGVLGSVLFDNSIFPEIVAQITENDFYGLKNKLIFETMHRMYQQDLVIDLLTLRSELERTDQLENSGGVEYLIELTQKVPTSANAEHYAKIVADKSTLRKIYQTANSLMNKALDESEAVEDILADAETRIMGISENQKRQGFISIATVLGETVDNLETLAQQQGYITGVPTGYMDLDKMTTGLHSDELIILAARPAVGKTAFALNIAQNVATQSNGVVAIFSLEMSAESLVNRMLCAEGSIDAQNMRTGNLTPEEWDKLFLAMGTLGSSEIYIDDTPGIKISEIRANCRRLHKEKGKIDLVVIDYLQLIESSGRGRENRQQEVSEISRQLKKLAKELKAPVIALSQLSRGVEQRQDKRPVLSDIRESGSIEQDADIVAFLYREDYYQREGDESENEETVDDNIIEVILEKNRSGARGTVKLLFKKEYNKFSSVTFETEPSF